MARVISKECLSLAAEYAVASELCRRGVYAQLTLGNRKRTDLLVDSDAGLMFRIQVKAKQGREWPGVCGVYGDAIVLVLVDYEKKILSDRPDFYILRPKDWAAVMKSLLIKTGRVAKGEVKITDENVPIWRDNYVGTGIKPEHVLKYRDTWENLIQYATGTGRKVVQQSRAF